jgi:hypothetical protein
MNVRLLRKIQKHILAEPRRFAMGIVDKRGIAGDSERIKPDEYNAFNPYEDGQKFPDCGTMGCIMGWGRILGGRKYDRSQMWNKLCSASSWPERFRASYKRAKTPLTRARIAARRIDHFIATKGME